MASSTSTSPRRRPPIGTKDGVHWSGTLAQATPPQIDSITAAPHDQTPDGGYLDLSLLGVPNGRRRR